MTIDFPAWLAATQAQAETAVERYLPSTSTGQERLHEAMTYVSVGGGKRFRPLLVAAAARLGAADAEALLSLVASFLAAAISKFLTAISPSRAISAGSVIPACLLFSSSAARAAFAVP